MQTESLAGYLAFIEASEGLKNTLRSGRTSAGRQESTAEHSWRLALFALALQDEAGAMDLTRILMLCLVHDLGEALHGDIPATMNHDSAAKSNQERADLTQLLAPLPESVRSRLLGVWEEYELAATPEAQFVKGLDKLETIIQHNQGNNTPGFDYGFNVGYGAAATARHPLLAALRALVDPVTRARARLAEPVSLAAPAPATVPSSLPAAQARLLAQCLSACQADPRIEAVWAGGSYALDRMDDFSDLDLLVVVEPAHGEAFKAERVRLASACGNLLSAFSGEHLGMPDLLICLFDQPLLHLDLHFVAGSAGHGQTGYRLLWRRAGGTPEAPAAAAPAGPDLDWIEARFWTWIHYAAARIGRGELMAGLDFLAFLRGEVLGPLALAQHGAAPYGVRRVETSLPPALMDMLAATVARYDARDCLRALAACVALYKVLRGTVAGPRFGNLAAERAASDFLRQLGAE